MWFRISIYIWALSTFVMAAAVWYWHLPLFFLLVPSLFWISWISVGVACIQWQFFLPVLYRGHTDKKEICLTFDDGPHPVYTPQVLDLLASSGVRAGFFCIGRQVAAHPELLKRILAEGHEVGNHTYTHSTFIGFSRKKRWLQEIRETDTGIKDLSGVSPVFFRPPFGITTPHLAAAVRETGHRVVGWNIRPYDTVSQPPERIIRKILHGTAPGSIILLHDTHERILPVLRKIIPDLQKQGFAFLSVSEMMRRNSSSRRRS